MPQAKQGKRNRIMDSALATFARRGFGASMSYIAEEAGVTPTAIDDYFGSKDDLIRELSKDVEARMTKKLQSSYKANLPYKERFMTFFTGVLSYLIKNPAEARFLDQFYSSPFGVEKARYEMENRALYENDPFYRIITEGRSQNLLMDIPLEAECALILGPLVTISQARVTSVVNVDDALMKTVVGAIYNSVAQ